MLEPFDGKRLRVTAEDGSVLVGEAEVCPAGLSLIDCDWAEEALQIGDELIWLSQIARIDVLPDGADPAADPPADGGAPAAAPDCHELMGELLEGPCWIADLFPCRVGADRAERYFAVERWFRRPERQKALHRRQAELLLRLSCYADMDVSFDSCESWERNPEPAAFVRRLETLAHNDFLRAVFPDWEMMIDVEPGDTWMTVMCRAPEPPELLRQLAAGAGLFLWKQAQ